MIVQKILCKLFFKYLAMKDAIRVGYPKTESFSKAKSTLGVDGSFNLFVSLSIREKLEK